MVYSDVGNEVDLKPDGTLVYGPEHRLPEIDSDIVGGHLMENVMLEEDERGNLVPPAQLPTPPGWTRMSGPQFDAFLDAMLRLNLSPGELRGRRPVVSADIRDDFVFVLRRVDVRPSHPPRPRDLPQEPPPTSEEQLEIDRLNANGGDPRF